MSSRVANGVFGAWKPSQMFLTLSLLAVSAPAVYLLADQTWSRDFGAYGPIVLVTAAWLLMRQLPEMRASAVPGKLWLTLVLLLVGAVCYIVGAAFDFITFETLGVYLFLVAYLYSTFGLRVLAKNWFPLLYLAFIIPPPNSVLADVTSPLKEFVSYAATHILGAFGLSVAQEGVTIYVSQYQLLVEDACSGMNSLVGLSAVALLYVYLSRGSNFGYSLMLSMFVVPIAVAANIVRIMILILLTNYAGNEVAQSYLHFLAGLILFVTSLGLIFFIDRGFGALFIRKSVAA